MNCIGCGGERFTETFQEETDVFEGYRFMALLPGRKCTDCGWVYLDPAALEQYERLIAERLCAMGARSEHALRIMRRHIRDLPATDL